MPIRRCGRAQISLADEVPETIDEAVAGADLAGACVPVGAMEAAGRADPHLAAGVSSPMSARQGERCRARWPMLCQASA